jgi:hypothetical protein
MAWLRGKLKVAGTGMFGPCTIMKVFANHALELQLNSPGLAQAEKLRGRRWGLAYQLTVAGGCV